MTTNADPDGLLQKIEDLSGIGQSEDGLVKITVDGGGEPTSVKVDPEAMRGSSRALGESIMTAFKAAIGDLREQVAQLIRDDVEATGSTPSAVVNDDLSREVKRLAEEAMTDFDRVRRQLMDRLPEP